MHEIHIDMDKKCSICGKKGIMDNGYCMECAGKAMTESIKRARRESMPENRITVRKINNLKVKGKIIEEPDPEDPGSKIRKLVTEVSFVYEGAPGRFDDVLAAITTDADVDASFVSPQGILFSRDREREV